MFQRVIARQVIAVAARIGILKAKYGNCYENENCEGGIVSQVIAIATRTGILKGALCAK